MILYTLLSTKKKTYKISGGQTGNTYQKCKAQGFPGGPVDRTLSSAFAFTAKGIGSIPGWGPVIPVSRMGRQKTKQKWQNTIFLPHKFHYKEFILQICLQYIVKFFFFFISNRKKRQVYSYCVQHCVQWSSAVMRKDIWKV